MIAAVEDKRSQIAGLCRRYGVERLDLFGSAAGESFDFEGSDLDFVVSFERRDPPKLFDRYFGLKEDLEALFGRGVDFVTEDALLKDPDFAESISGARVPLNAPRADAAHPAADRGRLPLRAFRDRRQDAWGLLP